MKSIEEFVGLLSSKADELKTELPAGPIHGEEEVKRVSGIAGRARKMALGAKDLRDRVLAPFVDRAKYIRELWAKPVASLESVERSALDAVAQALVVARAENEAREEANRNREAAIHTGVQQVLANVGMSPEDSVRATERLMSVVTVEPITARQPEVARSEHATVGLRKKWKWEVFDLAALPDVYVTRVPNKKAIEAAVKAGLEVPGVRRWEETGTSLRTKK